MMKPMCYVYSESRNTRDHGPPNVLVLTRNLSLGKQEGGSYCMTIQEYNRKKGVSAPLGHLEALGRSGS